MKKSLLPISLLIMLIIPACSKDGFNPRDSFNHHSGKEYLNNCVNHEVINVSPVEGDNTKNLLDAFEQAKAAGEGTVIQLSEGTFKTGFLEIIEFNGTLKGAGKGKTIIKPIMGLPCLAELNRNRSWLVSLISFIGGDITMSDFTFKVDDGNACNSDYLTFGTDLYILVKFTDRLHEFFAPETASVNALVENIDFLGGSDAGGGSAENYNTCAAIWFGIDIKMPRVPTDLRANGNLAVNNCRFERFWTAIDVPCMGMGNLTVINNSFKGLYAPIFYYDNINTEAAIANNKFYNSIYYDIYINGSEMGENYYPLITAAKRSTFKISNNSFITSDFGGFWIHPAGVSMYLLDMRSSIYPEENMPIKFFVENNKIFLNEGATGIVGINNKDAMIIANKFSGNGTTGISMNGDTTAGIFASQLKLLGNDFSGASYTEADILLGTNTMNCLVAGSPKDNIVNMGSNNKIAGMPR